MSIGKPLPKIASNGINRSVGRSKDVGPRRMDVASGLKESLTTVGMNNRKFFPAQSSIVLTVGAVRHGSSS